MHVVWWKAWHDIRARRKSFVFLYVILAIISGLFNISADTTVQGLALYSNVSRQLDGADIWLWLTPPEVKAYKSGQLHLSHVAASGPMHDADTATLTIGNLQVNASIMAYPVQQARFDRIHITDGHYLSNKQPDGIILDAGLEQYKHVHVGQRVRLTTASATGLFTVRGFEFDSSFMPYPHSDPTPVMMTRTAFRRLTGGSSTQHPGMIALKVDNSAKSEQILNTWQRQDSASGALNGWTRQLIASGYRSVEMLSSVFLLAFVLFSLAAGWLIISNLVVTAVLEQTRSIAIMKSVGFTGKQVRRIYLAENLVTGVFACATGVVVSSHLVAPAAMPITRVLGMAQQVPHVAWLWFLDLCIVLLVISLATFFPARRASRILVTDAFRFGVERPRTYGHGLLARLTAIGLPLTIGLGIKDLFVRPFRTVTAFVAILFSVATVSFALSMVAVVQNYKDNPSNFGAFIDVTVIPHTSTITSVEYALRHNREVEGYMMSVFDNNIPLTQGNQTFRLMAQSYSAGKLPYIIQSGRGLEHPGETIVGKGLLNSTGLRVGDMLRASIDGKPVSLKIVGQFFDLSNMGQEAVISPETLSRYVRDSSVGWIGVTLRDYHKAPAVSHQLQAVLGHRASVTASEMSAPPEAAQIQSLMQWLSAALAFIALLSLFDSMVRSVLERRKDFAVFKSLGMRPGQVVANVAYTGSAIGVMATIAGVPLGVKLLNVTLAGASNLLGSGPFPVVVPWSQLAFAGMSILLISVGVSLIPALRAGLVRPAEVLRAE